MVGFAVQFFVATVLRKQTSQTQQHNRQQGSERTVRPLSDASDHYAQQNERRMFMLVGMLMTVAEHDATSMVTVVVEMVRGK